MSTLRTANLLRRALRVGATTGPAPFRAPVRAAAHPLRTRAAAVPLIRAFSAPAYNATKQDATAYHRRADASLEELTSQLEELMETEDLDAIEQERGSGGSGHDWDIEYATGVVNLRLGTLGTYVINKQPPTQQIWLSSPTRYARSVWRYTRLTSSGPKRFDYDKEKDVWFTVKDGQTYVLHELLSRELSEVFGMPLEISL